MPSVDSRGRTPSPAPAPKRKRSPSSSRHPSSSRSPPPPRRRRASPSGDDDEDHPRKNDRQIAVAPTSSGPARTAETGAALRTELAKLSTTRAGGAYIPPARLKALMAEAQAADPGSKEYQKMSWEALKKSITGLVNKVAADNIRHIVPELFGGANLIRGRGLFCRAIIRAQSLSLPFTPVFASLVAIVNTKLPQVGELLVVRLITQFRRSFRRNDKAVCSATVTFIAHLVNQRVVSELLALEILVLLLEKPTDDSVEIAVAFMREVGAFLAEESPKANSSIYDRFRAVLYEGAISKRVQYMIEVLSQVRREQYKDNPIIPPNLDLVEEEDQITHQKALDDKKLNIHEELNMFKYAPDFVQHEEEYRAIKAEILGEDSDSEGSGSDSDSSSDGSSSDDEGDDAQESLAIQDRTETNLVNLRRTIYLTIMSSAIFEEATHKLLKLKIPEGQEIELCNMVIECCSQERTFSKFYGHIGERMCKLRRQWSGLFEECFRTYYDGIHRYETNRLRNIARLFGHLLATDSISWASFDAIHMNEDDTTSSSRIFVKILFQEMLEILGLKKLVERFQEPSMQEYYANMLPVKDSPKNTRFSVNFFTSIGLGALTEGMREHLKQIPILLEQQRQAAIAAKEERRKRRGGRSSSDESDTDSSSDLSSSDESSVLSSSSYSRSPSPRGRRDRGRGRGRSRSRSYSYSDSDSYSDDSRSPPPRRPAAAARRIPPRDRRDAFSPSRSRSRSSPPAKRRRSPSYDSRDRGRGRRNYSYDSRSPSRSHSPPPRRCRRESYSDSESRSPSPPPRRRRDASYSRSPTSRSVSPPPPPRERENGRYRDEPRGDARRYSRDARDVYGRGAPRRGGVSRTPPSERSRSPPPRRERELDGDDKAPASSGPPGPPPPGPPPPRPGVAPTSGGERPLPPHMQQRRGGDDVDGGRYARGGGGGRYDGRR